MQGSTVAHKSGGRGMGQGSRRPVEPSAAPRTNQTVPGSVMTHQCAGFGYAT